MAGLQNRLEALEGRIKLDPLPWERLIVDPEAGETMDGAIETRLAAIAAETGRRPDQSDYNWMIRRLISPKGQAE